MFNLVFNKFKAYFSLFAGALVLGFLAYIKYLRSSNKEQKENIDRLKKEIKVRKEVYKDEIKKNVFEAKQKQRANILKATEIKLDEIEKEINEKSNSSNDDNFTAYKL